MMSIELVQRDALWNMIRCCLKSNILRLRCCVVGGRQPGSTRLSQELYQYIVLPVQQPRQWLGLLDGHLPKCHQHGYSMNLLFYSFIVGRSQTELKRSGIPAWPVRPKQALSKILLNILAFLGSNLAI
jgi:hypothetical protein